MYISGDTASTRARASVGSVDNVWSYGSELGCRDQKGQPFYLFQAQLNLVYPPRIFNPVNIFAA